MAEKKLPNIAIFDFDDTLVYSDTLLTFLGALIGTPKSRLFLGYSILIGMLIWGSKAFSKSFDYRTNIKKRWLSLCLKDRPITAIPHAIDLLTKKTLWKEDILDILKSHIIKGDKIVIATGALDIYIHPLLDAMKTKLGVDFAYDHIICTAAEIENGYLTGRLASKNTVRYDKRDLVQSYLKATPHTLAFGYGNAPSDLPFLSLCDQKMVI